MSKTILILVRHGQYVAATDEKPEVLTELGRKQAALTGKRLREFKIDKFYYSTMPRAEETAQIIQKNLKFKGRLQSTDLLRECVPGIPPEFLESFRGLEEQKVLSHKLQADLAFDTFFKVGAKSKTILLVCHGNIIRYLICKTLGVDTNTWGKFDIKQCGISIVGLSDSDNVKVQVISHNDVGHIPMKMQTFM